MYKKTTVPVDLMQSEQLRRVLDIAADRSKLNNAPIVSLGISVADSRPAAGHGPAVDFSDAPIDRQTTRRNVIVMATLMSDVTHHRAVQRPLGNPVKHLRIPVPRFCNLQTVDGCGNI